MSTDLSDIFGPTPDCLPLDDLVQRLEAPAGAEERVHCEQHLAQCTYCASQVALFRGFQSDEPLPQERAALQHIVSRLRKNSPAAPQRWWSRLLKARFLAPAAIGLAAASVLIVANLNHGVNNLEAPVDTVIRSNQITATSPVGEITRRPSQLSWQPVAGAANYDVRILEVDRTEIWRATTTSAVIPIPSEVVNRIVPSKKLLWEVTALDGSGNAIASSGMRSFVVVR